MTSIDRIIFAVCAWWRNRRLTKAVPELGEINRAEQKAVRAHKPVKAIRKRRQDAITRALREGV